MKSVILSGDIGGTTRLMLASIDDSLKVKRNKNLKVLHQKSYKNKDFPEFKHIVLTFKGF